VDLLDKTYYVNAKYGVLTNFTKTIVYSGVKIEYQENWDMFYDGTKVFDAQTNHCYCEGIQPLMYFNDPDEYLSKFDALWAIMSKEEAKNCARRVDDNAEAHLASSIISPSRIFPVRDGRLVRGTWQNMFLLELDGPRTRRISVEAMGEQ